MTIHRITLDTRNFHFEAYGSTREEAERVMERTLLTHAVDYKLSPDWSDGMETEHFDFELGEGFRDRHLIVER